MRKPIFCESKPHRRSRFFMGLRRICEGTEQIRRKNIFYIGSAFGVCVVAGAIIGITHDTLDKNRIAQHKREVIESASSEDLAPMLYVNQTLYILDENQKYHADKESVYLGIIASSVDSSTEPNEEFQANDSIVGAKLYRCDNKIVTLIDGKCCIYRPYHQS